MRPASMLLVAMAGAASGLWGQSSAADDGLKQRREVFAASDAVKVRPAFIPLSPGAVTPKGWLRDWALTAAHGITGHLDEYNATFGEAWKGYPFEARGAHPDGTGWPLEQSSYWLDGAVRLAYILDDKELIAKVSKRLDTVVAGVLNGGESFIYWRPNTALTDNFNNWAHSHMGRALVAYYQATGKAEVLQALVKAYRDYPLPEFVPGFDHVIGAVNIDPMVDTFFMSGDRKVLENVVAYARQAGYRSTVAQWLRGDVPPGHNVIFYENIRVPALLYPWTGNKDDLAATLQAILWHDRNELLPMGLSSGEEWHAGIGATRNVETCNVAASMWTFLWMLRITGERGYADRIEKIFFNAGPAPVARDFKTMCYYQSANRYSTVLPEEEPQYPGKGAYQFTNIGYRVLCCVGNLNRVIPNYVMHMWMATFDHGLAATLYGPAKVHSTVADGVPVEIDAQTAYPFDESIALTVNPARAATFPLYLRIPEWCRAAEIKVNGRSVPAPAGEPFVKVVRNWRPGDKVTLRFPMAVNMITGKETPYPQVPYFRSGRKIARETNVSSPYGIVYFGPLLFSLPIRDEDPNREAPNAQFNYALDITPEGARHGKVKVVRHAMPQEWTWALDAPVQLVVDARKFDWHPTELQPLPDHPVTGGTRAKIVLVPYGCTKFRVSMFPVTEAVGGAAR